MEDTFETNQTSLFEIKEDLPEPEVLAHVNEDAPYLPYAPRSTQLKIIKDIREALDQGRHIVIESGTGTGKTIVSLAAALEHAVPNGKRIIYLTRTITQSDQVMKELKAISRLKPISGVPVTGRVRSCPAVRSLKDSENLSATVLSSICEEKKSKHQCKYFESLKDKLPNVDSYVRTNFPKSDELDRYCERIGACPYEMKKLLMKGCEVIAAPYVHILSEDIRTNFLRNLDVEDSQVVLVIDEAHNLIDSKPLLRDMPDPEAKRDRVEQLVAAMIEEIKPQTELMERIRTIAKEKGITIEEQTELAARWIVNDKINKGIVVL